MSSNRTFLHLSRKAFPSHASLRPATHYLSSSYKFCAACQRHTTRNFSSSSRQCNEKNKGRESFSTRLRAALNDTKIQWYPIPVGLGIGSLGLLQFYKVREREKARQKEEEQWESSSTGNGEDGRPKRRPRIRPTGPWFVWGSRRDNTSADPFIGKSK